MALIAKSQEYVIVCAQRQIFSYNTNVKTYSTVQLPQIERKKIESNAGADEKSVDQEKHENNDENNEAESNEHGTAEFGDIIRLVVSPCNSLIAVTTIGDKFLFVYQLHGGSLSLLHSYQLSRATSALRFTPNSKHLLIADKTGDVYSYDCQGNPSNYDAKWILGHLSMVLDILISNNSKYIITCDRDEKIRITNYPQSEIIESYCLGHVEFVSAIAKYTATQSNEHQLISISGDKTLRLWDYLNGTELFRLELSGRGLRMTQNERNELAAVLFDENFKIAIFESFTNDENKISIRLITEHVCENIKYISSIMYETDDCIWYAGLDGDDEIILKRLEIKRTNEKTRIEESNVDDVLKMLKQNLSSCKLQANEDITQLFKKGFDNLADYKERKKRRIEQKCGK